MKILSNYFLKLFLKLSLKFLNHYYWNQLTLVARKKKKFSIKKNWNNNRSHADSNPELLNLQGNHFIPGAKYTSNKWTRNMFISCSQFALIMFHRPMKTFQVVSEQTMMDGAVPNQNILVSKFRYRGGCSSTRFYDSIQTSCQVCRFWR